MQRVLDGKHGTLGPAIEQRSEDISRHRTWQDVVVRRELESSHVAVGAALALDGDPASG
jgi:hypothetical protein